MEGAGFNAGVEMEDGVESKDCSTVGPDSDFITPPEFVEGAGVKRLAADTAGAVYGVTNIESCYLHEQPSSTTIKTLHQ